MYPRFDAGVIEPRSVCRVLLVHSSSSVQLRTITMQSAYNTLYAGLRDMFRQGLGQRLSDSERFRGASCIVYRWSLWPTLHRGEIIYSDSDGYTEVYLPDEGESIYMGAEFLYNVPPFMACVGALSIEVELLTLGHVDLNEREACLETLCVGYLSVTTVTRTESGVPIVRLFDALGQDIEELVALALGVENIIDEGFDESQPQ